MCKQCVSGSFFFASKQELGNEARMAGTVLWFLHVLWLTCGLPLGSTWKLQWASLAWTISELHLPQKKKATSMFTQNHPVCRTRPSCAGVTGRGDYYLTKSSGWPCPVGVNSYQEWGYRSQYCGLELQGEFETAKSESSVLREEQYCNERVSCTRQRFDKSGHNLVYFPVLLFYDILRVFEYLQWV